jgi:DNA polymerase
MIWLDFETRSECDLKTAGVYNYARHPTTQILCMAFAFNNDSVNVTTNVSEMRKIISEAHDQQICAHNAAFERHIITHVLGIPMVIDRFYCTSAQARANCMPGSLEDVGRFMGASMRKDHKGGALVKKLCTPPFKGTDEDMQGLINYCAQDVRVMRDFSLRIQPLSEEQLKDYHVNERINDRGVRVDVGLCKAALAYSEIEVVDIQKRVTEITKGAITSVRSPKMREWVLARLGPDALKLAVKNDKPSIDKSVRAALLSIDDPDQVSPDVLEVIQAADDMWASSVAKFKRLEQLAGDDNRVRGAFVFAGGSATGRASSYGAQVHNFARKCADKPDSVRQDMVRRKPIVPIHGKRVTDVLKGMLRPALIPATNKKFVVADWASIEARITPWLSNNGQAKLTLFETGADVYKVNAAKTFNIEVDQVTKDQRQIGKVQELACGFAGGIGAFAAMGRIYGIDLPENEANKMVKGWRKANDWAAEFWSALEVAYIDAMRNDDKEYKAGRVKYLRQNRHLWYTLPSGRMLCYPYAEFNAAKEEVTYAKASFKPSADAKKWPRARLWKGLACENITQATAADILRHALRCLDNEGFDTVLHVHDEIVIETDNPDKAQKALERIMKTPPAWAEGLPLDIEVSVMGRYGK